MSDLAMQAHWQDPHQAYSSIGNHLWPWAKSMLLQGYSLDMEVRLHEDSKTDQQRKYYHGVVLDQIARQARVNGQKFPLAVWKEHFRAEYLGHKSVTYLNPLTGKKHRRRVRKSTEDLGVKAYAVLIERVTAFAVTELGVEFPAHVDPETGEILS